MSVLQQQFYDDAMKLFGISEERARELVERIASLSRRKVV